MDKKIIGVIAVIIVLAAIIGAVAIAGKKKDKNPNSNTTEQKTTPSREIKSSEDADLTIFYGQGCPHCKKVEDYILQENVDQKIKVNMKEVWYNKDNANDMTAKATTCGLSQDQLGVPLLYDATTKKCLTGDADVINLLKERAASAPAAESTTPATTGDTAAQTNPAQ